MRVKTVAGSLMIITGLVLGLFSGLFARADSGAALAPANGALREGEITLVVREPDQTPIPGATVEAIDSRGNQHASGTTDANGRVSLVLSKEGYYRVVASKTGYIDSRDVDMTGSLAEIPAPCEPTYDDDDCVQYQRRADGSFRWPMQASFPSAEVRTDGWIELYKPAPTTTTTTTTTSTTSTTTTMPGMVVDPADDADTDGPTIDVAPPGVIAAPAVPGPAAPDPQTAVDSTVDDSAEGRTEDQGRTDDPKPGDLVCEEWLQLLELGEVTLDELVEGGYGPCLSPALGSQNSPAGAMD